MSRKVIMGVAALILALTPFFTLGQAPSVFALTQSIGITPTTLAVDKQETRVSIADATDYTDLTLSFHHVAEKLEPNKQLQYGWRIGSGANNPLGVIEGQTNPGGNPGLGENGDVSVALPVAAAISNLEIYFTNTGNAGGKNDEVTLSDIALVGTPIPTPPIDAADPEIIYVTPRVEGERLNSSDSVEVDFTDETALKQVTVHGYLNGITQVPGLWVHPLVGGTEHTIELPLTGLAGGSYQIRAAAVDEAGNSHQINRTFVLDSTAPTVSIKTGTGVNDGSFTSNGAYSRISFKLRDPHGKLQAVVLNGHVYNRGGEWNDLNWQNINKSHLVEGVNTIYAVDAAGNQGEALTFVYDVIGPTIAVKDESLGGSVPGYFRSVSFKLFDAHAVDKVTINGVVKDLTNDTWSDINTIEPGVFGAVEGANIIVAYDTLGNMSTFEFTLDTTAPDTFSLVSPDDTATFAAVDFAKLDWSDSADASGVQYEVLLYKDGEWIPSSGVVTDSEWTPGSPLAEGVYGWKVSATDAAGNVTWNEDGDRTFTISGGTAPVDDGDGEPEIPIEETDDTTPPSPSTFSGLAPLALVQTFRNIGPDAVNTPFVASVDNATDGEVLGASKDEDEKDSALKDTASVLGSKTANGSTMWYLWLVALAVVVAAGWWFIAAARHKKQNQ